MNEREAQAALERVRAETVRAEKELDEQRVALAALENAAGECVLAARLESDQAAEERVGHELAAARARVDLNERALAASTTAIRKAQRGVSVAKAAALRDKARELWREAEPRLEKTAAKLLELFEYEGVRYVPPPVLHPSGAFADGSMAQTVTGALLAQIVALEREAAHLESVGGETPKQSLLHDVQDARTHLGSAGVVRVGPMPVPTPARKVSGEDIAKAYRDSQRLRG
jgi:hypothetical protein